MREATLSQAATTGLSQGFDGRGRYVLTEESTDPHRLQPDGIANTARYNGNRITAGYTRPADEPDSLVRTVDHIGYNAAGMISHGHRFQGTASPRIPTTRRTSTDLCPGIHTEDHELMPTLRTSGSGRTESPCHSITFPGGTHQDFTTVQPKAAGQTSTTAAPRTSRRLLAGTGKRTDVHEAIRRPC